MILNPDWNRIIAAKARDGRRNTPPCEFINEFKIQTHSMKTNTRKFTWQNMVSKMSGEAPIVNLNYQSIRWLHWRRSLRPRLLPVCKERVVCERMQKTILSIVPAAGTIAKDTQAYVPRRISVFIGDFGNGRLWDASLWKMFSSVHRRH